MGGGFFDKPFSLPGQYSEALEAAEQVELSADEKRQEWLKQRMGKFTASNFHKLMTFPNEMDLPKGALTHCLEVALEVVTDQPQQEGFKSRAMQWGSNNEKEAAQVFMFRTGKIVDSVGEKQEFIKYGDDVGCTPDGLIYQSGEIEEGIETKCPDSKTHYFYLENIQSAEDLKQHKDEYYWQCVGGMFITGAKAWYFISYDPRWKNEEHRMRIVRIDRDKVEEDIQFLRTRIGKSIRKRNEIITKYQ